MDFFETAPKPLLISERSGAHSTILPLILVADDQVLICLKITLMWAKILPCPLHTIRLFLPDV